MKKTLVYWLGLIIVGLSVWALFIVLWIVMRLSSPIRIANHAGAIILASGAIIFLVIGTLMMKEGRGEGR